MPVFRARWVLPIAQPPIAEGWVAVEDGRVLSVGGAGDAPPGTGRERMLEAAILPGLVNAHTHLELSWMRDQVPPAPSMPEWVERLIALRRTVGPEPPEPIAAAIREARAAGTSLLGDVTNTLAAYEPLADSEMSAAIFRELLGFNVPDPAALVGAAQRQIDELTPIAWLRASIVPHAPYSVSPALLRAIAVGHGDVPMSIHLGESAEEIEFLRTGGGAWRDLLASLGMWSGDWRAPGVGPVAHIAANGLLTARLLAVHCVQLTDGELQQLAAAGATVVTCPRSNRWTGAGLPPVERFYASGARVAVGTDSLSSVEDLNLFSELRMMRQLAPAVPARAILASATKHGADALGFGDELGTIEAGKRADLIAVAVPPGVADVEEYLVGGIEPPQVTWLST
ncbi:MAG TPA: amidohydrolase family protein [Vicinamibacterales bacterium]|nr:amidohydrolase family protein [Vicinamibacterales bacterium]